MSDYIELHIQGDVYFEKTNTITKLKELRSGFNNLKIRVESVIPLKSVDNNEDWGVCFRKHDNYKRKWNAQSIDFCYQFRINKEEKLV